MAWSKKPASYEDIEALPVGWVGELVEDELCASPRPAMGHAHGVSVLGGALMDPFVWGPGGPGGWVLLVEPELHFGRDVLVPDWAGWRRERLPRPFSAEEPFTSVAPDWVCEVLSPSTATFDRERKLPRYHREGVAHVWLIEPLASGDLEMAAVGDACGRPRGEGRALQRRGTQARAAVDAGARRGTGRIHAVRVGLAPGMRGGTGRGPV